MKMIHQSHNIQLQLIENRVNVLVMENEGMYAECVRDLLLQCEGDVGDWILSDAEKNLSISKKAECIINPWALDLNNKKVLTKLYSELESIIQNRYLDKYVATNAGFVAIIDDAIMDVPYGLSLDFDVGVSNVLKLYNVKFDTVDTTLVERIDTYIKIMHQVCGIELFVFINLKSYLNYEELKSLFYLISNEKIQLLLIESYTFNRIDAENVTIIDRDLCQIDL